MNSKFIGLIVIGVTVPLCATELCPPQDIHSIDHIEINNNALEEFILKAWTRFVHNISHAIDIQGTGDIKEAHQFYVPILSNTLKEIELRGVIEKPSRHTQQLQEIIEKILKDAAFYLFRRSPPDTTLALVAKRLKFIVDLDELGKLCASEQTRKIFFQGIRLLTQAIDNFVKKSAITPEALREYQDKTLFTASQLARMAKDEESFEVAGSFSSIISELNAISQNVSVYFHASNLGQSWLLYQKYLSELQESLKYVAKKWESGDKAATDFVQRVRKAYTVLFAQPATLVWCDCSSAFLEKRIALIVLLFNDVQKKYPDSAQRIVYTSLASGGLLQDALTIRLLAWKGYKNLDINLIDSDYKDTHIIQQLLDTPVSEDERQHLEERLDVLLNKAAINSAFEQEVGVDFVWKPQMLQKKYKTADSGVYVTYYDNVYDYVQHAQRWPALKTNILLMVDPGRGIQVNEMQKGANIMAISFKPIEGSDSEKPAFYVPDDLASQAPFLKNPTILLIMPYAGIEMYSNVEASLSEDNQRVIETIKNIIHRTGAKKDHVPSLPSMIQKTLVQYDISLNWMSDVYVGYYDCVVAALQDMRTSILYQLERDIIPIQAFQYYARKGLLGPKLSEELQDSGYRKIAI